MSDKIPNVYIEGNPLVVSCVLYTPIHAPDITIVIKKPSLF